MCRAGYALIARCYVQYDTSTALWCGKFCLWRVSGSLFLTPASLFFLHRCVVGCCVEIDGYCVPVVARVFFLFLFLLLSLLRFGRCWHVGRG